MHHRPLALLLAVAAAACGGAGTGSRSPVVRRFQRLGDTRIQRMEVEALAMRGPPAAGDLLELLDGDDASLAQMAAEALSVAPTPVTWAPPPLLREALLRAVRHPEPGVRAAALNTLAARWDGDPALAADVLPAVADPVPRVRLAAIRALQRIRPARDAIDLEPLRRILRGNSPLAAEAAIALAARGDSSPEVIAVLAGAASDSAPTGPGHRARLALRELGPLAATAAPVLAAALPGAPEGAARGLADTLGLIGGGDPAVVAALEEALDRPEDIVRVVAALALARLGRAGRKAEELLADPPAGAGQHAPVYAAEGRVLLGMDAPEATALLVTGLGDPEPSIRAEAAFALGRLASAGVPLPDDAVPALEGATTDPFPETRRAALRALDAAKAGR